MADLNFKYAPVNPILKWAGMFIIIGGIKIASGLINPLLLAIFFSVISYQPVAFLRKRKVSKGFAISIVIIMFSSIIVIVGGFLGNSIARFTGSIPELNQSLTNAITGFAGELQALGFKVSTEQMLSSIDPGKVLNFTAATLNGMGSMMGQLFLIILYAFFMLLEMDSFPLKFNAILGQGKNPRKKIEKTKRILSNVRNYLAIKTATSLSTGILIFAALEFLGINYAFIWGLIAFLLNYIPNIGSILAAIPAMMFAGIQLGFSYVFWTGLIYLVVNVIIGNIIEPRVMGQGMGLSTLVVIVSLVFWGWVLGPIGMFLSVPLTMSAKIFLEGNKDTQWLAILLGSDRDAVEIIEKRKSKIRQSEPNKS